MTRFRKVSVEDAVAAFETYGTLMAAAVALDVTSSTIRSRVREAGIKTDTRNFAKKRAPKKPQRMLSAKTPHDFTDARYWPPEQIKALADKLGIKVWVIGRRVECPQGSLMEFGVHDCDLSRETCIALDRLNLEYAEIMIQAEFALERRRPDAQRWRR